MGGCRRFEWVTMYFIAEKYDELLQNNDNVLCREAKLFLLNFKEMKETKQPSEVVSKLQMRKLVCDLQKESHANENNRKRNQSFRDK